MLTNPINDFRHAPMLGAMAAAEDLAFALDPVANDLRATVGAFRCEHVNRALEAIEDVLLAGVSRNSE